MLSAETTITASNEKDNESRTNSGTSISSSSSWDDVLVKEYENRIEPFTRSFVKEMIEPLLHLESGEEAAKTSQPRYLLDVGCGTGSVTLHVARRKQQQSNQQHLSITATDVSPLMVQRLRQRYDEEMQLPHGHDDDDDDDAPSSLEVLAIDGQDLPKEWTDRFDYAVGAFSVIFFPNVLLGLQQIYRCLKPGTGKMVISAWGDKDETPAFLKSFQMQLGWLHHIYLQASKNPNEL